VNPASTGSATAVTYRASSETSQAIALLTSTASMSWTSRRLPTSAPLEAGALANSSATASLITIGVFAPAGCTELTRMLCGASQCAQVRPRRMIGVLAGAIAIRSPAAVAPAADQAQRGPGQDDRAAPALFDHERGSGLDGVPDAEEVDLDLVAERLLLARAGGHHPDACVGHHDIHRAQARYTAGHSGPQGGSVADVGLGRNDPPAQSLDLRYRPAEVRRRCQGVGDRVDLAADIHRDHVGAVLGQAHRMAPTLSPGRPCDEHDFAVEPSRHSFLPRAESTAPSRWPIGSRGAGNEPGGRGLQPYDDREVNDMGHRWICRCWHWHAKALGQRAARQVGTVPVLTAAEDAWRFAVGVGVLSRPLFIGTAGNHLRVEPYAALRSQPGSGWA